jgi:uncharacterized protein YjeT (DUF2065 family)
MSDSALVGDTALSELSKTDLTDPSTGVRSSDERGGRGEARVSARARNSLAFVLVALGGVATLLAAIAIYAHHVFVDRNGFADSVTEAIKQPAVSREISVRLGDALVDVAPDLVAGERVIEDAAASIISSGSLDAVVRRSALTLHDGVFEGDAEKLALDLSDGLQLLGSVVATQDPELRSQISAAVDAKVVELERSTWIRRITDTGRVVDELAIALPIAALLLFGGAIAVAADRRRTLGRVGWAIAGVGPVLFVIAIAVDTYIGSRGWVNPEAVNQAFGVFLGGIDWIALWLGIAGAAIVASASGRLTTTTADHVVGRSWSFLRTTPRTHAGRALRALVLLALGVALLVEPLLVVQIVLVALGFVVVVEGMTELVALLAGAPSQEVAAASESPSSRRRVVGVGAIALGILALAGLGALALTRAPQSDAGLSLVCNGSADLCDRPIDRVAFASAHNAMSSAEDGFIDPNHRRSLVRHLDAGIRGLLIDSVMARPTNRRSSALTVLDGEVRETARREVGVAGVDAIQNFLSRRLAKPTGPSEPYLCHIVCEFGALPMEDELRKVRSWLQDNPNEVLVIVIQDLVSPEETERAFKASGLYDYAYTWNPDEPAPTLRQMIERDRRLLVMAEKDGFENSWYQPGYERLLKETPYDTATVDGLRSDESCRPNRGNEANPLFLVNHWAAVYPPRPSKAEVVNEREFILDRVERCRKIRNAFPNLIAVDFAGIGDVVAAAAEVNGLP